MFFKTLSIDNQYFCSIKPTLSKFKQVKKDVIISQGKRSLWNIILAAFLYSVSLFCLYLFFAGFDFPSRENHKNSITNYIIIAIFCFPYALYYSAEQAYHFDFKNNRYKHERAFLFVKLGRWKLLPELEYVSVFESNAAFEIKLWYVGNKHFTIYHMFGKEEALEAGKKLATTLEIDLLDATDPHDSKWIDL